MTTRLVLIAGAAIVLAGLAAVWWLRSGPDPSQFAYLRDPRVTRIPAARMLVVEATGDPNLVAGGAFKLLFATYYKLEGVSRGRPPAPRARWPNPAATPKTEWLGRYALPLPDTVTTVPNVKAESGLRAVLQTWEYGDVAEILHVGSYSSEQGDIERLLAFIAAQGYRAIGEHEEDYVRGPGMIFAGDTDKYLTIIRLRVAKSGEVPTVQ